MINRTLIELVVGAVALIVGLSGSYLIAAESQASFLVYIVLAGCLVITAGVVVLARIQQAKQQHRELVLAQLPAEIAGNPTVITEASVEELIVSVGNHAEAQRQLLVQNFKDLMQGNVALPDSMLDAQNTLNLIRAELSALEDQYNTEIERDNEIYWDVNKPGDL